MSKRPTTNEFRKKALENPKVREEYEALAPAFEAKRQMIARRKRAGLTELLLPPSS